MDITIVGSLLSEAKSSAGKVPVCVIKPGWGSSGYYKEEALQSSATLFDGVQMYWNHPSLSENYERPERDLRDLAGVLTNTHYDANHPNGAGIYGEAVVFDTYRKALEEIAPYIGVSIRAQGKAKAGEAEGRAGNIVESIDVVQSVDYVTRAGAGGKVLTAFREAAEAANPIHQNDTGGQEMDLKEALDTIQTQQADLTTKETELKTLNESIETANQTILSLQEAVSRYQEAELINEAKAIAVEVLKEAELPEITKERLAEKAAAFMVTKDDEEDEKKKTKKVDKEATKAKVQEAIKAEGEYISKLTGGASISGMGSHQSYQESGKDTDVDLTDAFSRMGLSESAAKTAAVGH